MSLICAATGLAVGKAWGNVVLADHGRSVPDPLDPTGTPAVALGVVPEPVLTYAATGIAAACLAPITSHGWRPILRICSTFWLFARVRCSAMLPAARWFSKWPTNIPAACAGWR